MSGLWQNENGTPSDGQLQPCCALFLAGSTVQLGKWQGDNRRLISFRSWSVNFRLSTETETGWAASPFG